MNVLITGGCGFLGRHYTAALAADHDVTVVDDLSNGLPFNDWPEELREHRPRLRYGDFRASLRDDHYDLVIHLAAHVGGRSVIEGDPAANLSAFANDADLFRWAARTKPGRIIYMSSSAAYPVDLQDDLTVITRLKETDLNLDTLGFGMPDEIYGWSKLAGEVMAKKVAEQYGVPVLCPRPFSGYGFDQSPDYPMRAICERAARHEDPLVVWGSGQQGRDFVHVDDLVRLTLERVAEVDGYEPLNIGTGRLTTFIELAGIAAKAAGYAPQITPLADKPEGVAARVADVNRMHKVVGRATISVEDGVGDIVRRLL